jgi:DNA-binding transcriptional regulator/RsmH inhibitor MraZ
MTSFLDAALGTPYLTAFSGASVHTLDHNRRMSFPKSWLRSRGVGGDVIMLWKSRNDLCIEGTSSEIYNELLQKISKDVQENPKERMDFLEYILGNSHQSVIGMGADSYSSPRITIPSVLYDETILQYIRYKDKPISRPRSQKVRLTGRGPIFRIEIEMTSWDWEQPDDQTKERD